MLIHPLRNQRVGAVGLGRCTLQWLRRVWTILRLNRVPSVSSVSRRVNRPSELRYQIKQDPCVTSIHKACVRIPCVEFEFALGVQSITATGLEKRDPSHGRLALPDQVGYMRGGVNPTEFTRWLIERVPCVTSISWSSLGFQSTRGSQKWLTVTQNDRLADRALPHVALSYRAFIFCCQAIPYCYVVKHCLSQMSTY